jgi:large subunit ribosomal protein L10
MPTPEKVATVAELREKLARAQVVVLADYRGMKVPDLQQLRNQLRPTGSEFMVVKNTLLRLAAGEQGQALAELLQGPTAAAFCYDDIAGAARVLNDLARTSRVFRIKGGILDGRVLSPAEVAQLATIPPRPQLLAQVVGGVQAPIANLLGLLQAGVSNLLLLIQARAEQLQHGQAGQPAAAPA